LQSGKFTLTYIINSETKIETVATLEDVQKLFEIEKAKLVKMAYLIKNRFSKFYHNENQFAAFATSSANHTVLVTSLKKFQLLLCTKERATKKLRS